MNACLRVALRRFSYPSARYDSRVPDHPRGHGNPSREGPEDAMSSLIASVPRNRGKPPTVKATRKHS